MVHTRREQSELFQYQSLVRIPRPFHEHITIYTCIHEHDKIYVEYIASQKWRPEFGRQSIWQQVLGIDNPLISLHVVYVI